MAHTFVLIISLILAVSQVSFANHGRMKMMEKCAEQEKANLGDIHKYQKSLKTEETMEEPENFACFAKCMLIESNMMSSDGKITIPEQFPKKEDLEACLEKYEGSQDDLCAKAAQAKLCFMTHWGRKNNEV